MKLHHIGYLVKNISKSITAFEEIGYTALGQVYYDQSRKADICFLEGIGTPVELVSPREDSDLFVLLKQYPNRPYHICYEVENLQSAAERLQEAGFLLFKEPQSAPAIGDTASVVFLMHRGTGIIELLQV